MRLIDADALIAQERQFTDRSKYTDLAERMIELLEGAPTIEAIPVEFIKREIRNTRGFYNSNLRFLLHEWEAERRDEENA